MDMTAFKGLVDPFGDYFNGLFAFRQYSLKL